MICLKTNDAAAQLHFDQVKVWIKRRIRSIQNRGIRRGQGGRHIVLSAPFNAFLTSLLSEANLCPLIKATPQEMRGIIGGLGGPESSYFTDANDEHYVLHNIFVSHGYSHLNNLDFIRSVSLDSCTYCNRSYIYALDAQSVIKPEIDHFFPQSTFSIFALSFYNLIPACQTCNGIHVKGQKSPLEHDLLNPYELKEDDFKFTYKINSIDVLNPLANKDSVSVRFLRKINGNVTVFKLDELYKLHSDHALELVVKSKLDYSASYRTYLESYKKLQFNSHEIDRMILGNYALAEDMHKRPLAKLYQDLGIELGLITRDEIK